MTSILHSGWSFTQGLLLGQLSVCVLLFAFIKFFIFGEVPSSYEAQIRRRRLRSFSSPRTGTLSLASAGAGVSNQVSIKKLASVLRPQSPLTVGSILAKTYYNVKSHQPESVDWFNVLVAQTIAQLRHDAQQDNAILISLTNLLNGPRKPDFLDEIRVTEINLGEEFPICSNCRIIPVDDSDNSSGGTRQPPGGLGGIDTSAGRLQARMDVDISDAVTLGLETKLVLNYPKPGVLVMPVALAVSVVRFSGTLSISFTPSNARASDPQADLATGVQSHMSAAAQAKDPTPPTTLTFSFLPDYRLELSTRSLLGSRARLQDVPKIAQLVEARLHSWFDARCVEPRFQQIILPSLWPRRRNTRGGADTPPSPDDPSINTRSRPASRESAQQQASTTSTPARAAAPQPQPQPYIQSEAANNMHIPSILHNGLDKPSSASLQGISAHATGMLPNLSHSAGNGGEELTQQQQLRSRPAATTRKSRLAREGSSGASIDTTSSKAGGGSGGVSSLPGPMPGSLPL